MDPSVVWVGWLALFLIYEIAAALRERGTVQRLTLSRNVWKWFDRPGEKVALAVFLLTLTAHLVLGAPGAAAVILTGAPVALVIALEVVRRQPAAALLLALPLLLGADKCSVSWPQPQPTPTATPEPTPTPEPPVLTCANLDCAPGYHCVMVNGKPLCVPDPQPTPTPTPSPGACPAVVADGIEHGRREMTAKHHVGRWYDTTPRVCGNVPLCVAVGRPTQYCCPLGPEGEDWREACETLFLGGPTPRWEGTPGIRFEPSELTWLVNPFGTGKIRSCDRAGQTCSPWLDVAQ